MPETIVPSFAASPPPAQRMRARRSGRLLLGIGGVLCAVVGLVALRYILPTIPAAAPLPNLTLNRNALVVHAGFAAVALLLVPVQFWTGGHTKLRIPHRFSGYVSALAIYTAACSAYWLAPTVRGGMIAGLGFTGLSTAWVFTLTKGIAVVRERDFVAHRRWMIRVSSLTFAAVTLRLWLMLGIATGFDFDAAYRAAAWLCWVPNLLLAEAWLVHERTGVKRLALNGR